MQQIACHACDLIHDLPEMPNRASARCVRCGTVLLHSKPDSVNRTIAWATAGVVLYGVAVTFPFLGMRSGGLERHTALLTGIREIYTQGMTGLAILVLMTCVIVPILQLAGLLYVMVPIKLNSRAPFSRQLFSLYQQVRPWSMVEVFMLGILVSLVKLAKMATIVPGVAVFAFTCLVFALTFAVSSVDAHLVWERLDDRGTYD